MILNFSKFKAGTYKQQYQYKSFSPEKINTTWIWDDPALNVLLETATRKLGELNAFTLIVPNIDLFIQMHIIKEANTSNKIEGTQTNIDEALLPEEDILLEKRDDWQEVQNYIKAMGYAIDNLEKLPLSNRLLNETHNILMQGVRGEHKSPGDFRKSQNWIGGSNLSDAVYIPPHHTEIPDLMGDLELFLHNDAINVPHLIKIAIAHYQFETIHPYLDGNGRIGRLLIILYLVGFSLLKKPSLYLSSFFEKHRSSYYNALSRVREANDISHWVKFFLNAIIDTADDGKNTFDQILKLRNETDGFIIRLGGRAANANKIFDLFYQKPLLNVKEIEKVLSMHQRTIRNVLNTLEAEHFIVEYTGNKRNKKYVFERYLKLF
jgi:Fic family protein